MKVGDLVKCLTGSCGIGIIVEHFKVSDLYGVILLSNNRMCAFQPQYLEVLSGSR